MRFTCLFLLGLLTVACGQAGSLYLPEDAPAERADASASQGAAAEQSSAGGNEPVVAEEPDETDSEAAQPEAEDTVSEES